MIYSGPQQLPTSVLSIISKYVSLWLVDGRPMGKSDEDCVLFSRLVSVRGIPAVLSFDGFLQLRV